MKKQNIRIDELLVQKGLYPSRAKAQSTIIAGLILVNEQKIDKPGKSVAADSVIRILGEEHPYVSRGGMKLAGALKEFNINVSGKICLDVGASTGGFTDCLLQKGAAHVYAVDVGYGCLAWKLRNEPRVTVLEKTNIRYLTWEDIDAVVSRQSPCLPAGRLVVSHSRPNFAVIDVSFISLSKVLPAVISILERPFEIIALIKPQFEAKKEQVGKGGIIKDPQVHAAVLEKIKQESTALGLNIQELIDSPITGADGNQEWLIHLTS